jgi:ABC-2 type transport system ATP-binding protein
VTDAVVVTGLTRRFGDFVAVDDVSFTVAAGEIFAFLGPNGAGKTTTIRMLAGLLPPTAGTARVAGYDAGASTAALRSSIGYMSQSFSLYGDLTPLENIELFAGLYGVSGARLRQRMEWILDMSELGSARDEPTSELPLGLKQRLALGCAMLHEPPVLFLDEPTSGVDPLARRAFWDLIHSLAAAGTTVLVSTHYMEEAEYCHRLILMNRGRIIADGTPAELRATMTEPLFEVETDDASLAVEALAGAPSVLDAAMFGRNVHVVAQDATDAVGDVHELLRRRGLAVHRMQRVQPSLEDVFVAMIRREGGAAEG